MPLERVSFEEAKRRANQRIAEWISETKAAGIVRLQDRYADVFKKIDWRDVQSQKQLVGKLKPIPGKYDHSSAIQTEGCHDNTSTPDIPPSRLGRRSQNQSRCKSRSKSRQTPERCQSSRQTSGKRSESRKRYRDSASLIYGDNRNNRSSLLASVCSDALSLIQDGLTSEIHDHFFKAKININEQIQTNTRRAEENFLNTKHPTKDIRTGRRPSYIPIRTKGTNLTSRLPGPHRRKGSSIFPANFRKRRRSTKPTWEVVAPISDVYDADFVPSDETQTSSGLSFVLATADITTPPTKRLSNTPPKLGPIQTPHSVTRNSNRPFTRCSSRINSSNKLAMALVVTSGVNRAKSSLFSKRRLLTKSAFRSSTKGSSGSSPDSQKGVFVRGTSHGKIALRRFRGLVRTIMCVMLILRSTVKTVKRSMQSDVSRKKRKSNILMTFDPSYYSSATTTYGHLSDVSRAALQKIPTVRTESDIRVLTEIMSRLPLFIKYSRKIKEELARVVWYDIYEKERIIIRQGDMGARMYFVVSGTVSVHRTEMDPKTGAKVIQHLRDIEMGSTFGELALIRNLSRTYTAVCKVDSEFLSVDKEQFNKVLRSNWEESWNIRHDFLTSSNYFTNWTSEQLKLTADVGLVKEYNANTVIFGDEEELSDWVYFILNGKCWLIEQMSMVRSKSPYKRSCLTLSSLADKKLKHFLDKPYGKRFRQLTTDTHCLTITTLRKGDYFGVGENMKDRYVVAATKTEVMHLNSASYSIHSKRDELTKMMEKRDELLPSAQELHRRFEVNRCWWEYKKAVVSQIVQRRAIPNCTTVNDIPRAIREDDGIPESLALDSQKSTCTFRFY